MPPNQRRLEVARQWLDRARGSYARACQAKPPEGFWEDLCFDAQQATEKAIKALLIRRGLRFPYTHDIGKLLEQLVADGVIVSPEVHAAAGLTEFAAEARYPGWGEPVTEDEYLAALATAKSGLKWVTTEIG